MWLQSAPRSAHHSQSALIPAYLVLKNRQTEKKRTFGTFATDKGMNSNFKPVSPFRAMTHLTQEPILHSVTFWNATTGKVQTTGAFEKVKSKQEQNFVRLDKCSPYAHRWLQCISTLIFENQSLDEVFSLLAKPWADWQRVNLLMISKQPLDTICQKV